MTVASQPIRPDLNGVGSIEVVVAPLDGVVVVAVDSDLLVRAL
jgi:hypothetical protein